MAGAFWWTQGVDVFVIRQDPELHSFFDDSKTFLNKGYHEKKSAFGLVLHLYDDGLSFS
jgi:hypothetical protein